ncbi:MAG: hypothetical protein AAF616_15435 [Bacteroidota bacterium]
MEPNDLNRKLDFITEKELGVAYDAELMWQKVNTKLHANHSALYWRMLAVACVTLLIVTLPLGISDRQEASSSLALEAFDQVEKGEELLTTKEQEARKFPKAKLLRLQKKGLTVTEAKVDLRLRDSLLKKTRPVAQQKKNFSTKDISVIQASLESPNTENGSTMIKARLFASSTELNIDYQPLNVRINEKK